MTDDVTGDITPRAEGWHLLLRVPRADLELALAEGWTSGNFASDVALPEPNDDTGSAIVRWQIEVAD
ncbi:MAG: hypothetical protein M0Z98_02545 [Actinomycetales bacterium]|nr:hypothetical protein [Actinomycetales bacterium]